jgi:hypothetical protein
MKDEGFKLIEEAGLPASIISPDPSTAMKLAQLESRKRQKEKEQRQDRLSVIQSKTYRQRQHAKRELQAIGYYVDTVDCPLAIIRESDGPCDYYFKVVDDDDGAIKSKQNSEKNSLAGRVYTSYSNAYNALKNNGHLVREPSCPFAIVQVMPGRVEIVLKAVLRDNAIKALCELWRKDFPNLDGDLLKALATDAYKFFKNDESN